MFKRGWIRGRKGEDIFPNVIFIVINLLFFSILLIFIFNASTGAFIYEQAYAKQIALLIDYSTPKTDIKIDLSKAIEVAGKNEKVGDLVVIDNEKKEVLVSLTNRRVYVMKYFSDYEISSEVLNGFLFLSISEDGDEKESLEDIWSSNISPIIPPITIEGEINLYYEEGQLDSSGVLLSSYKESEEENIPIVAKIAKERNLNFNLVRALIKQESGWNPNSKNINKNSVGVIVSTDWGLMQVNDASNGPLGDVGPGGNCNKYCPEVNQEVVDKELYKTDNEINIQGGTCYLVCLRDNYGIDNVKSLVAAYNAGPGRLIGCEYESCSIPSSTRNIHVPNIIKNYKGYSGGEVA